MSLTRHILPTKDRNYNGFLMVSATDKWAGSHIMKSTIFMNELENKKESYKKPIIHRL